MASHKQFAANRRNAARSTGPRTPEGKRRVAANAVQHGFYGTKFTIPGESQPEFHTLTAAAFDKAAGEATVLNHDILHLDRMLNSAERSFSRALRDLTKLQKDFVDPAPSLEDASES